ncbi:MAG: hypothetical protein ACRDRI_09580 [Pseudonocardiaceae bacterium]
MTPIHGTTDPRFQAVRDAFTANFRDHGEVGAALCVYHRGRRVVDLWGGIADLTTGTVFADDIAGPSTSTPTSAYPPPTSTGSADSSNPPPPPTQTPPHHATLTTATTPQSDALDQTLGVHTRFGLGYALPSTTFPLLGADSFGHGGRGGSLGAAHPPTRTTFGYVMNHMHTGLTTDRRFTNLATAITTSL